LAAIILKRDWFNGKTLDIFSDYNRFDISLFHESDCPPAEGAAKAKRVGRDTGNN
jgi:hypothetical protein